MFNFVSRISSGRDISGFFVSVKNKMMFAKKCKTKSFFYFQKIRKEKNEFPTPNGHLIYFSNYVILEHKR